MLTLRRGLVYLCSGIPVPPSSRHSSTLFLCLQLNYKIKKESIIKCDVFCRFSNIGLYLVLIK